MSDLLEHIQIETNDNPEIAIIWMHGLGADGNDFVPMVRELDLTGLPGIRFIFPHAKTMPVTINNGYVIVVRNETADANNLKSLSDLAKVANTLVFGGGAEFPDRADGLPGLKRVYNAEFKEFKQFAKLGLRYDALSQKDIDVANGAATDWQIGAQGLTALDDDKGLFPPYYVAPVVRQQVLDANPKLKDVLESLGSHLDNATMRVLNAKVETDHEEPKDVAEAFLKEKGLLP